jgi:ankyrin repeat protein
MVDRPTASLNQQLFQAVRNDDVDRVDDLLQRGANLEATETEAVTPLQAAAALGRVRMVRHLVARGANINAKNARGGTVLTMARFAHALETRSGETHRGQELQELVHWLRQRGAVDVSVTGARRWWQWQFWK